MDHFFILNCNGRIVGNPRGYRTIRGAIRESERPGSPAHKAIWAAFFDAKSINPNHTRICKIAAYNALDDSVKGLLAYRFDNQSTQNRSI